MIAFSGTVQVMGAITLLYGALAFFHSEGSRLNDPRRSFSKVQKGAIGFEGLLEQFRPRVPHDRGAVQIHLGDASNA